MKLRVAVIGAGASGLISSVFASSQETSVTVFEKQSSPGRKIAASGNGRCNLTNAFLDFSKYHGANPRFVNNVFSKFGLQETINFFYSLGIPLIEEKNGRMFPMSLEASSVVSALIHKAENLGVTLLLNRMVDSVKKIPDGFAVTTAGEEVHNFDRVILASGSCAYPSLGGSESGYSIAASMGHRVISPFPAILPMNIPLKSLHRLQGIKWNCRLDLLLGKKVIRSSEGEVLFTAYGLSGPASLDISREVNHMILSDQKPEIAIDFFPSMSTEELNEIVSNLLNIPDRKIRQALHCIVKKRVPELILTSININPDKLCESITNAEINKISEKMKMFIVAPGKPRGFSEAVTAAGGVSTGEIVPDTMESKIVKNLFVTGELLDIDGDSGGFNLQFAWSTGVLAGLAQTIRKET